MLFIWPQDSKCMMSVSEKSISWCTLRPWANLRLGASDSRLYYFLSKLTEKLFCAAARRMAEEGKQASFDYATASLAGRHPDSKAGMVTITMLWIFGALTLGWVG